MVKIREVTKKKNLGEKSLSAAVAKSSHEESINRSQICQGKKAMSTSCPRETIQMTFVSSVENWVMIVLCHLFWMGSSGMQFSRDCSDMRVISMHEVHCVIPIVNSLSIG